MSGRNQMLDVFTAIGSAHAGAPLTPDALLERLKDPAFRARFNGPPPPTVTFPDERTAARTAALAAAFENATRSTPHK